MLELMSEPKAFTPNLDLRSLDLKHKILNASTSQFQVGDGRKSDSGLGKMSVKQAFYKDSVFSAQKTKHGGKVRVNTVEN